MKTKKTETKKVKKLTRSKSNKVLGGVCAGLGEFFDVDPTIIRVIFIIITLFGGSGIFLYVVLWLIIPSNGGITIDTDTIKKNADEIKVRAEKFAEDAKDFSSESRLRNIFGFTLLILGIIFLLQNFGFFNFFNPFKLWPLIIIFLAIALLFKNE